MAKTCANQVVNVRIDVSPATLQKVKVAKINLQNVKLRLFCEGKYGYPSKKYQHKLL